MNKTTRLSQVMLLALLPTLPLATSASDPTAEESELTTCPDTGNPAELPGDRICHFSPATNAYVLNALRTQWLELDSAKSYARVYVNFPGNTDLMMKGGNIKLYLRTDLSTEHIAQFKKNSNIDMPPSRVELVNLDCNAGEQTVLQIQMFDIDGKRIGSQDIAKPKPVRISRFYESPLAQVCRREFIFKALTNGEQFLARLKVLARDNVRAAVPDRNVPVSRSAVVNEQ